MWQFIRNRFIVATTSMLVTLPLLVAGQSSDTRSRIVELFQQAHQAEESNDFPHAVGLYRSIVAIDPNLAEVWSNLGVSLYHEHQYKDAIVTFQRGIALKPELLVPHLFTGMAYLNLGEADKALGPLKAALAIEPNNQESILALSEAYAQTRQFATAVRLLQKALKRDPDSESFGSNLAVTYLDWAKDIGIALRRTPSVYGRLLSDRVRAANDAASADQAFRDTIALAPGSVEARLAYARFLMEGQSSTERLRASEEQVNAADRIFPGDLDVSAIEIRLAVARKDIPRASTLLKTVMHVDPAFTLANLDALAVGLPTEEARKIAEEATSLVKVSNGTPNGFSSKLARLRQIKSGRSLTAAEEVVYASAAWHLHRYEEGLSELVDRHRADAANEYWLFSTCEVLGREALEQTLNAHPDSVRSHLLLADFAIQQDNFTLARTQYEAALSLSPHDPEIRLLHVRLLETTKENEEALREARRGLAEFPSNSGLNFEAGELTLRSGGDAEIAARYLEQALQTDPRLVRARIDLADAYAELRRLDDAIREINRIIDTDDDGTLHFRVARWYRETGQPEDAAKALEFCKRIKERRFEKETKASNGDQAK